MTAPPRIAVVGLGYVGLPLAVALARHFEVVGYDSDPRRIAELRAGRDRTGEVDAGDLAATTLALADDPAPLRGRDVFIITVPTPVDAAHRPDLGAVEAACGTVGAALAKGAIVVLESTVYPGVTEEVCGPILASGSGLRAGADFFLGYSPERTNPGDRAHGLDRIAKVVAGQTPEVAARLAAIYGKVAAEVFVAASIKAAEAAKVIENAQRDINIAFVNEVTRIFGRLDLSIHDVLDAARTKWNFLPFQPGLVGGHCIGVDPYWLADLAQRLGHEPEVILAGRRINDSMGDWIAGAIHDRLGAAPRRILVLGLTFKENVPDLRNSKVVDLVRGLARRGHAVDVHDPLADAAAAAAEYRITLLPGLEAARGYDAVVGAVPHRAYAALDGAALARLLAPGGLLADVEGMWRGVALPAGYARWSL